MTYLVTGGAGFIGSHLTAALLREGNAVRVLDNLSTGSRANVKAAVQAGGNNPQLDFVEGDLRDFATCEAACEGVTTIFHLGALGSVPRSVADPLTTNAVNVQGTLHLLSAAQKAGVQRLVFSSSSSVYGDTPTLPKHEAMRPLPRSPYAVSKLAGEAYCRAFFHTYGLETVALRYFNVFGPRQSPHSAYAAVIPRFLSALQNNELPEIHGDGLQSRDFTYVDNVVQANLRAADAPAVRVAGEVFNIACAEQFTVLELLTGIAARLSKPCMPLHLPQRAGDVRHSRADISAACERLGYQPTVYFVEGLDRTVEDFSRSSRPQK